MPDPRDSEDRFVYVYCVIRCDEDPEFTSLGMGERGDAIYTVHQGDLAAVVSDSPSEAYEARRRNMMAHTAVLEEVMSDYTILPLRFSTVAPNAEIVRTQLLGERRAELLALWQEVDGRAELGLKAFWHEDTLFQGIVDENPQIRSLRDSLAGRPAEASHAERMKLGELVEVAMKQRRQRDSDLIMSRLKPLAHSVAVNENYGERMVLNAAFLVDKDAELGMDEAVQQLDTELGERLMFKYVGSAPPYNFVKLVMHW